MLRMAGLTDRNEPIPKIAVDLTTDNSVRKLDMAIYGKGEKSAL